MYAEKMLQFWFLHKGEFTLSVMKFACDKRNVTTLKMIMRGMNKKVGEDWPTIWRFMHCLPILVTTQPTLHGWSCASNCN